MLKRFIWALTAAGLLGFAGREARGQSAAPRVEVGGQLSIIDLRDNIGEKPLGVGGRAAYNFTKYLALDAQVDYYPQNPSGNFGQTVGVFGLKAGVRAEKLGLFAKARPGFIHFGGDFFAARIRDHRTQFALDLGGVLEFYPSRHTVVRIDVGDTLVTFGGAAINTGGGIVRLGTTHNLQTSLGFGVRF